MHPRGLAAKHRPALAAMPPQSLAMRFPDDPGGLMPPGSVLSRDFRGSSYFHLPRNRSKDRA
jgi:hypothetical protein